MTDLDKEIEEAATTIFDTFDLKYDTRHSGSALRSDLVEKANLYGRINKLATNALFLHEQAKNRYERAQAIAWERVWNNDPYQSMKSTQQKIIVNTIPIVVDGTETTLSKEAERVNLYEYVYSRGKDKVKEITSFLEIGRSLLSWDKTEAEKL